MKEVIIVGTGGFAAELADYIYDNNKYLNEDTKILGYLDVDDKNYNLYDFAEPFLGSEDEYKFKDSDVVYMAIGNDTIRKKVIQKFQDMGLKFSNFIHHRALISKSVKIGIGNIFTPNVIIGPNTTIGDYNLFNYNTSIAHDCTVGDNNNFAPNIVVGGYCSIQDDNFFGISCGLTPNVTVGSGNKIQAGLIINKKITNDNIVFSTTPIKSMPIYKGK
jgi:sugar O-acyltransferase (sialic acid O-acetyltransferase NeuD family)